MYTASCLCGSIQLKINQEISFIYICHCKQCQKAQGGAFVAIAPIETIHLEVSTGHELIGAYSASETKKRVFCTRCASPLYSARIDRPDVVRLRVGIINEELHAKIYSHAFMAYKACWYAIAKDDSQKYKGHVES